MVRILRMTTMMTILRTMTTAMMKMETRWIAIAISGN